MRQKQRRVATSSAVVAVFAEAFRHFRTGRLDDAELSCRQVLAIDPHHAESLHLLGIVAYQGGRHDQALDMVHAAIASNPMVASYHSNLGGMLRERGRLDEAAGCFRDAIGLKPDYPEAHNNLGRTLRAQGHPDRAVTCFRKAIALRPHYRDAHHNLGTVLLELGQPDQAVDWLGKAIELGPNHADAHNDRGNALKQQGRLDEAAACYRSCIDLKPDHMEAHNNLGTVLGEQGRLEDAITSFRNALALKPDYSEVHYNLGNMLRDQWKLGEAAACYGKAIELKPYHPEAYNNLGNVLRDQGELDAAVACYNKAIEIKPDYPTAHYNSGNILAEQGWLAEAVTCFGKALDLQKDDPGTHNNLGLALGNLGLREEALAQFARAFEIKPDYFAAYSNRLFMHNYLVHRPPAALRDLARQYGALVTDRARPAFGDWPDPPPGQPLRVGLVSSDLRSHPVGYFLEGLLRAADPARIAFLAFPSHHAKDELTARIKPCFTAWTPIHGLCDEAAARLIRDSGVQVLLDLSGHTAHNRLPVFAWRPAPMQAAWLGYFATTGVAEIDYIIGDPHVAPPEEASHFTERVWRLPEIYYCFSPPDTSPETPIEVSSLPALSNGYLTFGCFNNLTKLNDTVIAVWARILHAVPDSRLLLKAPQLRDASVRASTHARFARHGIGSDRLLIELPAARADYLQAYHRIDIALDPFPFPGGTTSFEALWMGLPVLTRRGDRFLSHAGETILRNAGLPDWIAEDDDDYVAKAAGFARDLGRLAKLRAQLRAQVLASPLFDASRFARHFEDAMEAMWKQRQAKTIVPSANA